MSARYTEMLRELRDRARERDPRRRVSYVPARTADQMITYGHAVEVRGEGIDPPRGMRALVYASGTRGMAGAGEPRKRGKG